MPQDRLADCVSAHGADGVSPAPGYDVPRGRWRAFLARFVARHGGALAAPCALSAGAPGESVRRRRLPFHDARYSLRTDGSEEILVTLGEPPYMLEPYFLVDPERIRVEQPPGAGFVLRLESRTGAALVLSFARDVGRTTGPLTLLD
jgi:hypothetical protein